ncbi:MAG: putative toxin-antitoxin system toxin component, PIN family [Rhodanobacter sp.]|jgi:putative PIN family toxin of toxin-antitoxin system|nr:putative toxin-antitoxin system toxin component, PIN family [Rhodanobacter sp.]
MCFSRRKFARRFAVTGLTTVAILDRYLAFATLVEPATLVAPVSRDAKDDHVLACALAARASFIVSGDSDLLTL